MHDVRFRALAAAVAALAAACGGGEPLQTDRLELLEHDALAATEVAGTRIVGRRSDSGESFLGESGVEVEALFDVTGSRHDVADAYVSLASREGWRIAIRCPTDATLLIGSKQFDGFVASVSVVVQKHSGAVTLTASYERAESTTTEVAADLPASCRP